jgi:hypothetical protein
MRIAFYALTVALLAAPATGDPSSAAIAAGGIVFTQNTAIRMSSEDLFVSPDQVRAGFVFENRTAADVRTLVAFPLPDMGHIGDPARYLAFRASVDGKVVAVKLDRRVLKSGVRARFYWPMTFAAHRTVTMEIAYQPVTGIGATSYKFLKASKALAQAYCIDPSVWKALDRAHAKRSQAALLQTDYILRTANNWKGPIGRFHLTLDKKKPDAVVALCWPAPLTKTGATTYEFTASNFAPTRDIHMLVLE